MGLRILCAIVTGVLVTLFQLLAYASANVGIVLLAAVVLTGLSYGLWSLVELDDRRWVDLFTPGCAATVGVSSGLLLAVAMGLAGLELSNGISVPAAVLTAALIIYFRIRNQTERCDICRLPGGRFRCPRCPLVVCTRSTCWTPKYYRCTTCHQYEVIVFPLEENWWRSRYGSRAKTGQCLKCLAGANEADLRECGQCHWTMCRRCWDFENGRCIKCGWITPDLPKTLTSFLVEEQRRVADPDHRSLYEAAKR